MSSTQSLPRRGQPCPSFAGRFYDHRQYKLSQAGTISGRFNIGSGLELSVKPAIPTAPFLRPGLPAYGITQRAKANQSLF